jgi:hypothetical protein
LSDCHVADPSCVDDLNGCHSAILVGEIFSFFLIASRHGSWLYLHFNVPVVSARVCPSKDTVHSPL